MDNQTKEENCAENTKNAQNAVQAPPKTTDGQTQTGEKKPKTIPCPRCKMPMQEDERCATCGFKKYVPLDEKKRNKIKLITTIIAMVVFVVIFVILQFKK